MKKQNNRNKLTRITLALLLILSMLGNTLILPVVAQESAMPADEPTLSETPTTGEADTESTTPTLPEPILLTAADVPEFISAAALEERGAVERMRSEETNMSSVIFRNEDGTRTMYMYGLPVKYTATDGTVRDKSTNLVSVSTVSVLLSNQPVAETMAQMSTTQQTALQAELGILDAERAADTLHMLSTALTARQRSLSSIAYTTLDNDVYALFPTNLTEGMTLVFGGHSIRMTPATGMTMTTGGNVTKTTTASLSDTDVTERLLYPNVFGPGTAVQYTPTLTGVKEEILLSYNVGKNSFDFLLETDGLILTETNGQFVLVNPETEQQVGKLGEIIVFDSAGQIVRGNMTAQTIKNGQIYGITISVDQEFLASATYPVAIDPSFNIHPFNQVDSNLIEDVSIYSDQNCEGYTFIEWHQIGTVIGGFYEGQAAFRFPAFYDQSILFDNYSTLTSDRIGSVTLHLKTTSNTSQSTMYVGQYTVDWPNTFKLFGDQYFDDDRSYNQDLFISNIPNNDSFSINITGFVKEWLDYNYGINDNPTLNPEQGILLYDLSYPGSVWIQSLEYDSSIYVTLDYSDTPGVTNVYMNNRASSTFLAADVPNNDVEMLSGLVSDVGSLITWTLVYRGEDRYTIHPNGQTDKYLNIFGEYDSEIFQINTWYKGHVRGGVSWIVREELSNGTVDEYVLGVDKFGDLYIGEPDDFNDDQRAWRVINTASYNAQELTSISAPSQIIIDKGQTDVVNRYDFSVSPANAFWSSAQDFEISIQRGSAYIGYNEASGVVTANEYGVAKMRIRHIPTAVETTLEVIVPKYELTVVHYYDEGFVTRYGGIGNALEMIEKCSDRVSDVLAKVFLLKVINIYGGEYYSLADEEGAALDCDTNCVTRDELKVDFVEDKGMGSNVAVNILWTGHRLEGNPTSASWYKQETHVIIITPHKAYPYDNKTGSYGEELPHEKLNKNSRTLLHEISHQFFALDHYCKGNPCENKERCNHPSHNLDPSSRRDGWCIMDNDGGNGVLEWTDITARNIDEIFCEQCKAEILAHLEEHH